MEPIAPPIDIGLDFAARIELASGLTNVLAESYALYIKTQSHHWNVTGPLFATVHQMTETQYLDLAIAIDTIAERIRSLGELVELEPGVFPAGGTVGLPDPHLAAEAMVADLVHGNERLIATLRQVLAAAVHHDDQVTAGLLTDRLGVHEKTAWMLRSLLS